MFVDSGSWTLSLTDKYITTNGTLKNWTLSIFSTQSTDKSNVLAKIRSEKPAILAGKRFCHLRRFN